MKKVALIFALAVIAPSLALAWLAVRSLRDQELVIERQQTLLCQGVADSVAKNVVTRLEEIQSAFNRQVEALVQDRSPREIASEFDTALRRGCPLAEVGFAVSLPGQVIAPSPFTGPETRRFRVENDRFLCSVESVEVYWNGPKGAINLTRMDQQEATQRVAREEGKMLKAPRTVVPEKDASPEALVSKLAPEEAAFQQIVGDATSGTLARFLQNKLNVMFWLRSPQDPKLVFGAQINLDRLVDDLRSAITVEPALQNEICIALLNDSGRPVALSNPNLRIRSGVSRQRPLAFKQRLNDVPGISIEAPAVPPAREAGNDQHDWKRPFVATEIGDALPHWELAVYLLDPRKPKDSARTLKLTLGLLIAVLVLAIAVGSWLVFSDLRRQLRLARQKTDFVSNVSHELKTPLTSIRMFSEMLAENRVTDEPKRRQFLGIITAETARLTRLINNVLDFARLERGEKKYQMVEVDLAALTRETAESYRPHLEATGFKFVLAVPAEPIAVRGDRDALAQVLVNLLSNAEKYSDGTKEIEVRLSRAGGSAEVVVLDRGLGVPGGCEAKIFDQFYRAHDSLACGIQGSGLGLTLARQIARAHGGEVSFAAREGGGSCFTLRLPTMDSSTAADAGRH